jgi:hypothetical protein
MVAQACEDIGDGAVIGDGVIDAAGGEQREAVGDGKIAQKVEFAFFAAEVLALEFDEEAGVGGIGGAR